jgi:low affinity Fe/Cu permease
MDIAAKTQQSGSKRGSGITLGERFNRLADQMTIALGSLPALAGSVLIVVVWGLTGPIFNFSDTWQLFINTTTTVVTFWMVFVIQNSANRSSKATQLKLDEIIRSLEAARNDFIALDRAPESELAKHEEEFEHLVKRDVANANLSTEPAGSSSGH